MYEFVKAKGVYLIDKEGNKYIDLISGIAVNNIGHRNKAVRKAVKKQLKAYLHQMVYGEYIQAPQIKLAKSLVEILPDNLQSVYLLNSGSEAIEGALKLVKKATGRHKIVAFRNAYHGSTSGALSLMDNEYYSGSFKPLLPQIQFAEFNNIDSLDVIDKDTAGVFIEPIQGESGYKVADEAFLKALRKKCNETSSLLVFDEIQSGMGRTGTMFAFEQLGVIPDVLCLAKGLGGGMPISCFISSKEHMDTLKNNPILGHITTFGGHPVSAAAAHATVQFIMEEQVCQSISNKENLFRKLLEHSKIKTISGKGLMLAVHLSSFEEVDKVINYCYEHGLIIDWFLYANTALRISPPLIITDVQITEVCTTIMEALNQL
ncbi:MAG: aspartate aminotransferase family protein [Bacteroidia bacterium]